MKYTSDGWSFFYLKYFIYIHSAIIKSFDHRKEKKLVQEKTLFYIQHAL